MKKVELKNKAISLIEKMEQNTFLFPKSWSEKIDMIDYDWSYKTYHSGSVGINRYHNFNIYDSNDLILDIQFRGNKIQVNQDICEKTVTIKDVLFYIEAVYNELHSFKNHDEGKRKLRKQINDKKSEITRNEKELKELKQRLLDSSKIK